MYSAFLNSNCTILLKGGGILDDGRLSKTANGLLCYTQETVGNPVYTKQTCFPEDSVLAISYDDEPKWS